MSSSAAATVHELQLSPERLDCYRVALELNILTDRLVPRGHRDVRAQLTRAALSVSANLAEGCGRRAPGDKAHFLAIARGSAMECAAIFDVLHRRRLAPPRDCQQARSLLVRVVQMLTKLERAVG
jgi:four helix bundle protein